MKKIVITCLLLCIALVGMAVPTFAESYDMLESNYGNNFNDFKYNYLDNSNIDSYKNIEKEVTNIGNYSIPVVNTKYSYYLNADLKTLYNNSEYVNYFGTNYGTTSAVIDDSFIRYYFVSTFNPNNFDKEDCLVSQELIPFNASNLGNYRNEEGAIMHRSQFNYFQFAAELAIYTSVSSGGGFVNADTLLSGSYSTYSEVIAQGYTQGTTTSFIWWSGNSLTGNRTIYLTEFYKMGSPVDTVSKSSDINSNIQKTLILDRNDLNVSSLNINWSYADFNITSIGNAIYEKSNNIFINSISSNNGSNTYSLRVINNNETPFITFCKTDNSYAVIDNTASTTNINASFYFDDSLIINDYSNILNSINTNCLGIITNTDDIKSLLTTNNTLNNNIYTYVTSIYGNVYNMSGYIIEIKNLLEDLQVNEINNIYTDIQNTYNIDIDLEIKDLIHDLQLNIGNVSTTDNVSIDTKTDLNTLSNNLIKPLFDEINTNNLQILYILPLACGVILLLL